MIRSKMAFAISGSSSSSSSGPAVDKIARGFLLVVVLFHSSFLLLLLAPLQSSGQQVARSYELKFQSEVDNSTIVKAENQQQIFKCQIRLAPTSQEQEVTKRTTNTRLRTLVQPIQAANHLSPETNDSNYNETTTKLNKTTPTNLQPANVSLTVDWFKDNRLMAELNEPVSIITVELKPAVAAGKNDKRNNKTRIEVKNTWNGNQLKLTSRLKISQLRASDSGHYKCLAKASFQMAASPQQQQQLITAAVATTTTPSQVQLIEQWLESNSAILSVVAQQQLHYNSSSPPSNNISSKQQQRQPSNDVLHATKDKSHHQDPKATPGLLRSEQKQAPALGQHDNGTSNGNMRWIPPSTSSSPPPNGGQFSDLDDEDLARQQQQQQQQQQSFNFISGTLMRPTTTTNDAASANSINVVEDDDETPFRWRKLFPVDDSGNGDGEASSETFSAAADVAAEPANDSDGVNNNNNNDSLSSPQSSLVGQLENIHPHNHHHHHHNRAGRNGLSSGQQQRQNSLAPSRDHQDGAGASDKYFDSVDRLGGRLAKLVHRIAPELSCYTSMGEHYRGTLAQIADGRHCLSWIEIRQHLLGTTTTTGTTTKSATTTASISASAEKAALIFRADGVGKLDDIHHNHCRNPTMDPRGPWCFVRYEQDLDLGLAVAAASSIMQPRSILISSSSGGGGGGNDSIQQPPIRYIQRQCSVAPCSEYLWLYIVAPPLGLLVLLSCLITLVVRYYRRRSSLSHHCYSRRSKSLNFGIRKLLLVANGNGKFAPKKFTSSSSSSACKSSCGRCVDEDIFEIVDDIDWSDGTTDHSLSPKSQESMKLSAANSGTEYDSDRSQFTGSGSTRLLGSSNHFEQANKPKGKTVGPVFATLRCQARNNLKTANNQAHGNTLGKLNKSSTFIEQRSVCKNRLNNQQIATANSTTGSLSPKSSSLSSPIKDDNSDQSTHHHHQHETSLALANSGHLISCSSTTEDIESSSSFDCCREKCTNACELPLISPESVSIAAANQQQQLLYEGKFIQVQMGCVKRKTARDGSNNAADIGAQVALCALKSSANSDFESIFEPTKLKLRNLNHLNILKLIGYSINTENEIGFRQQQTTCCTLVFDMGQLVDLNDWLRQQSKDIMMSCEPGGELGTRRNLTCFAKQIALALDYLHDRGIVHKDLACRNCFLDPTKMLVKLASFNQEFANNQSAVAGTCCTATENTTDEQLNSLRSMIRPKYLLDYYVIDSRPADSQLLPLSWIPLESILFNKFNMQTDVWSFGCLVYELFSLGEVAYFGYSSKQVIDAVRSNLMPPQPLLCPNGIYKLMCKCLSDIPSMRPNVKQIYEQLNLYSGQCSSFLDHHLCSLAGSGSSNDDQHGSPSMNHIIVSTNFKTNSNVTNGQGSISKTKSYANIQNYITSGNSKGCELDATSPERVNARQEVTKIPLSKSINLTSNRLTARTNTNDSMETNHYDEPMVGPRK